MGSTRFDGEEFTLRRLAGVLLGLLGVFVLIGGEVLSVTADNTLLAQFAMLAATRIPTSWSRAAWRR